MLRHRQYSIETDQTAIMLPEIETQVDSAYTY